MLNIQDELASKRITFHYAETSEDAARIVRYAKRSKIWAFDTESTGLNCYHPSWELRTFQFGNKRRSFVIPARFKKSIKKLASLDIRWIGHNAPHDVRCVDRHLGFETGMVIGGETYISAHHSDPRNREEGGVDHGLKDLCEAFIDRDSGKWERALKAEFKRIEIPLPGEFYKSGVKKGQPKVRKAKLSEGWSLIDPTNLTYIAYAGADPILTYHLWALLKPVRRHLAKLYEFDHKLQMACDRLHRRGIKLDAAYTERFRDALDHRAHKMSERAAEMGCKNIYSGVQVEQALTRLGARLTEKTPTGALKTDDKVLKYQAEHGNAEVKKLVHAILVAKQVTKRREAYANGMLREMDAEGRIHPSINSLKAVTARMSVSSPALQQLPTKEGEE